MQSLLDSECSTLEHIIAMSEVKIENNVREARTEQATWHSPLSLVGAISKWRHAISGVHDRHISNTDVHPKTVLAHGRTEESSRWLRASMPKHRRVEDRVGCLGHRHRRLESERADGLLGKGDAQELVHPVHAGQTAERSGTELDVDSSCRRRREAGGRAP
jgi:hypothetical protein